MCGLGLPPAPPHLTGPVKAWSAAVAIPTYLPDPPDKNPMFLERRVYQGSSGRVYPLPFYNRIGQERIDREWQAVHLENQYVRLMILPQLGGRIHVGLDKTNGYDFFYRQNVIKPALVGLAGPWISGGVEFNWPQHHRPATFMPTDVHIETHADGSITAWFSDHDPMNRLKGMHGVCLHPGQSLIELKVRLYNRTPLTQTFLWWANVGARVHERYQSFFPPDVHYVADHARRATSTFPCCSGLYYGVNYADRPTGGIPDSQRPTRFVPPGDYPPHDLSWYANIPVPTSYMATGSSQDFFGGYDHAREAGFVHIASHHISPGKKQWTWGNHPFGYAWDANLTDSDGPYIELMAGVYTDNQPDFSFLAPGETRTFSQFWYPIRKIGPAQQANTRAALSLSVHSGQARLGIAVSAPIPHAQIRLEHRGRVLAHATATLAPDLPFLWEVPIPRGCGQTSLRATMSETGRTVIEYQPAEPVNAPPPRPATEPPLPASIASADALYLAGVHLDQYRHATRHPELYWIEALQRDPFDSRCNNAMGLFHLRRGEFELAAGHFRRAIATLTRHNANPADGEPFYNLGLALRYLAHDDAAYDAFYKATWNYAWQSASFFALAQIDCQRQRWELALEHLDRSLRVNADHLLARNLKALALERLGQQAQSRQLLARTLSIDPLDFLARYLLGQELDCDTQTRLDLALNLAQAGQFDRAMDILENARPEPLSGTAPLVFYYRAVFLDRLGKAAAARKARLRAAQASPDYCFPARLEEIAILRSAMESNPSDPRAPFYLGCLLYDRRRHAEAIDLWERSARLDPSFSIVFRNLGIARFNILGQKKRARTAYDKAFAANPADARLLYERDQLHKRLGLSPRKRLSHLLQYPNLVRQRDDLSLELCALYNRTGQPQLALEILRSRRFQPWEGGEGMALAQFIRAHLLLGQRALHDGNPAIARQLFESALAPPANLGEAFHPLANRSEIHYWLGKACHAAGDKAAARSQWKTAAASTGDFQDMSVRAFSESSYFAALSLRELGRRAQSRKLLRQILSYAAHLRRQEAHIDYFATSLPTMLLFEDDLQQRQCIQADLLSAQAHLGLGHPEQARRLLKSILQADPNHPLSGDLLRIAAPPRRHRGKEV